MTDVATTTTTCPACRAAMRDVDTFCWTCGSPRGAAQRPSAPDRLEVVHHPVRPDRTGGAHGAHGAHRTQEAHGPEQGGAWRVIALVAAALVVAVVVAGWWLLRPGDTATTAAVDPSPAAPAVTPSQRVAQASPVPVPASTPATSPEPQYPTGVLVPSRVSAPGNSPDSADAGGRTTTYVAANVLDADPATAWRTEGNAAGSTLRFTFDAPVRITEVGLVNGFAKVDPYDGTDRYDQGRRVLAVTWTFDSPTGPVTVPQRLSDGNRSLQVVPVPAVVAGSVALTIDAVTAPGSGGRFDRTAISDVRFANP